MGGEGWACVVLLVAIGMAESGFATMQSTLVLLGAPEERRGGAMGHSLGLHRDAAPRDALARLPRHRDRGGTRDSGQ